MSERKYRLDVYPESQFGGFSDVDGSIRFYTRVHALLEPSHVVLDIGCGRGAYGEDPVRFRRELRILRGKCKRVIGIDVDQAAEGNPYVDEFRLIRDKRWPVESESIDLCISDYVLEHIPEPDGFFAESARVLKRGGHLCIRTPNAYGYVALVARCVPNRWHSSVLRRIGKTRGPEDTFPTVYRCNSARRIRAMMRRHGFVSYVAGHQDEPTYLVFSKATYSLGAMLHRLTPGPFRGSLFAFGRKAA